MSTYVKRYDRETKGMYFFNWRCWVIRKNNDILNKVSNSIKHDIDREPISENFWKPK